jgi:hypothetical protein
MRSFIIFFLFAFNLSVPAANAQNSCDLVGEFKLRKSLDGTKNEQLPAVLAYEKRENQDSYFNVDLATSFGSLSCGNETYDFNIAPKVEYHRSTGEKEIRNSSIGLNADYGLLKFKPVEDKWYKLNPYFLLEAEVKRDSANDETTRKYALLLTGKSFKQGAPGGSVRFKKKPDEIESPELFRWYPYIGIESYESLAIIKDGVEEAPAIDGTFAIFRLSFELYPFRREGKKGLQIITNHTYRRLNGTSELINKSTRHFETSFNYFFDKDGHVGLGVDYENGSSPSRNFLDEEKTTVAVKLSW